MHQATLHGATGKYALATGEAADYRLRMLHDLYGPGARRVLLDAGLRGGMRVAVAHQAQVRLVDQVAVGWSVWPGGSRPAQLRIDDRQ